MCSPLQALLRPDDSECSDRLAKLIDQTYNPKVLSALELASTTGRELLEALLEAERAESDEEGAGQSSRAGTYCKEQAMLFAIVTVCVVWFSVLLACRQEEECEHQRHRRAQDRHCWRRPQHR